MGELASRFPEMIEELKSNNDLVILSRYIKGGGDQRINQNGQRSYIHLIEIGA